MNRIQTGSPVTKLEGLVGDDIVVFSQTRQFPWLLPEIQPHDYARHTLIHCTGRQYDSIYC